MTPSRFSGILLLAALAACGDKGPTGPPIPGALTAVAPPTSSAVAGGTVPAAALPSVKVATARGKAIAGAAVVFTVTSGGGSIPGGSGAVVTDASGVAVVPGWTLGTVAGTNVMTATVTGVAPITFTVTGAAGAAAKLAVIVPPSATGTNRAPLASQPVVQVQDIHSNPITTGAASVSAAISSGGGTLQGTTVVTAVNGVATFANLAIAGVAGPRTLTFAAAGLTSASASVTTTAGAAAGLTVSDGNNQSGLVSTPLPVAPAVIVRDEDGNVVTGASVVFAVTGGGGSVTGATASSGADGVARVGSWTLGETPGANSLSATTAGVASAVSFTATAAATVVLVNSVVPATLTPGVAATITGAGFSPTPANNTVTLDGVAVTVNTATATTLSVTIPAALPCTPTHDAVVSVTVSGTTGTRLHPLQVATQHALTPGQSVVLATASAARCNELSNTGGLYYVNIYNTNTTYSTTGAAFELRGATGAAALRASANVAKPMRADRRSPARRFSVEAAKDLAHINLLERDMQFLRQNGRQWRQGGQRASSVALGGARASAVGDQVQVRLRDIRVGGCNTFIDITGRVAYMGTKSIIIEDNSNPLAGTIDTTYTQIGSEFDTVMWPILEANYGNALANDAVLDNNGRIVMVFTDRLRLMAPGIAGFVSPCDFFQRTTFASSNVGEYFYAVSPVVAGNITVNDSPPEWRWGMRGTIIHEVKHIVSSAERFSRNNGTVFEESWLEETTARLSEELYERARYGFAQRANLGYGSASNPVGPYCGVRACSGQPSGIFRVFQELADGWYAAPELLSPIGRRDDTDFSFYATGWSLLRWAIDASASSEATILRGLTQDPTRTGVTNFEQHTGTTLAAALPRWTMAMVVDDHPGFTSADAALRQPSWNLRNVYLGYDADWVVPWAGWPLSPFTNTFGNFAGNATVVPGSAAVVQLSGVQGARQLLELKASGANAAAPAELRMIIVRVQ
jgi:hypothetical protein